MSNWLDLKSLLHYASLQPIVRVSLLMLVVTSMLTAYVYFFCWRPEQLVLSESSKRFAAEVNRQIEDTHLNEIMTAYFENLNKLIAIEKKLSIPINQAKLMRLQEEIASANQISIQSVMFNQAKSMNGYTIVQQELTFEGSYLSIKKFINGLLNIENWIEVKEANFIRSKTANKKIVLRLDLTIYSLYKESE